MFDISTKFQHQNRSHLWETKKTDSSLNSVQTVLHCFSKNLSFFCISQMQSSLILKFCWDRIYPPLHMVIVWEFLKFLGLVKIEFAPFFLCVWGPVFTFSPHLLPNILVVHRLSLSHHRTRVTIQCLTHRDGCSIFCTSCSYQRIYWTVTTKM